VGSDRVCWSPPVTTWGECTLSHSAVPFASLPFLSFLILRALIVVILLSSGHTNTHTNTQNTPPPSLAYPLPPRLVGRLHSISLLPRGKDSFDKLSSGHSVKLNHDTNASSNNRSSSLLTELSLSLSLSLPFPFLFFPLAHEVATIPLQFKRFHGAAISIRDCGKPQPERKPTSLLTPDIHERPLQQFSNRL